MENNYEEIDNLFYDYFKDKEDVPNFITNTINHTLNNKNSQYTIMVLIKKIILTIISILTITSGFVFAKDLQNLAEKLIENIFGNYNNGISSAVKNGYVEDIDMQYIDSNDLKIKVDQIILDDYNLGIIFNIDTKEKLNTDKLFNINFKNILITDEDNNILFAEYENQDDIIKYCEENNFEKGTYNIGYVNCSANGKIMNKKENNIIYSLYTTSEKFPKSKKLNIKFDKIYLLNNKVFDEENNIPIDNHYATIEGNWDIDIDLEEIKDTRKTIEYAVSKINDKHTDVLKASLSMANMRLELITDSDKIDFEKLHNRENSNVLDMIPFDSPYIETNDGKKFFQSNFENNGYETLENGKIKYYTTFDYTYFDKSETIKVILPTNKKESMTIEMKINNTEAQ